MSEVSDRFVLVLLLELVLDAWAFDVQGSANPTPPLTPTLPPGSVIRGQMSDVRCQMSEVSDRFVLVLLLELVLDSWAFDVQGSRPFVAIRLSIRVESPPSTGANGGHGGRSISLLHGRQKAQITQKRRESGHSRAFRKGSTTVRRAQRSEPRVQPPRRFSSKISTGIAWSRRQTI